jgi:hypothetical protein
MGRHLVQIRFLLSCARGDTGSRSQGTIRTAAWNRSATDRTKQEQQEDVPMTNEPKAQFLLPVGIREALCDVPEEFVTQLQQEMFDSLDTLVRQVAALLEAPEGQPSFRMPGSADARGAALTPSDERQEIAADLMAALIAGVEPRLGAAAGIDRDQLEFIRQLIAYGTE